MSSWLQYFTQLPAGAFSSRVGDKADVSSEPLTAEEIVKFKDWLSAQSAMPSIRDTEAWVKENTNKVVPSRTYTGILLDQTISQLASDKHLSLGGGELKVPGFGLPLNHLLESTERFPVLVGDRDLDWLANTLLIREACMLELMETLTNKPEWWVKVFDSEITSKWKMEALGMDWGQYLEHADFTPNMVDLCINELRTKAALYEKTGLIPVMDYSACAIKSDSLISAELAQSLKDAVRSLEEVSEDEKDWHPGSDNKVLDLVHPSLYALVYGLTRVVVEKRIGISDALENCGTGTILPKPHPTEVYRQPGIHREPKLPSLSHNFQWLPCDVDISANGAARITSYINNLHPIQHADLYPVIERFIEKALPAWDIVYRWPTEFDTQRLTISKVGPDLCKERYECRASTRPLNEGEPERDEDEEWEAGYEESTRGRLDLEWFERTHKPEIPDVDPTKDDTVRLTAEDVKKSGFFNNSSRIQVIVKLANIHLTPDKPKYEGGSWHIEGQLNERICATALFYYDSDNITDCHLDFRTRADRELMVSSLDYGEIGDHFIEQAFSIDPRGSTLQNVGAVLARPGRSLFFPNFYQHRVSPFQLANPSREGHRKILALFLVDPVIPVLSTSSVPPQQKHWWTEASKIYTRGGRLPLELTALVMDHVDFPITEEKAKQIRKELMIERSVFQEDTNQTINNIELNVYEH
ncbi:unnamed protein product [Clonostachys rosea]|uniref:Fe2OG dioxygenase domain-containing protein n=1 Tax=Bionectria ochroleuca TaxID=29856 RepID=A0ABY6TP38_BIOOC|nr:unnamed protein product [Clonostachys rosea]